MKFKVLAGSHHANRKLYVQGEIIETTTDLEKAFNTPHHKKFEKVHEEPKPVSQPVPTTTGEDFDSMTQKDLIDYAATYEIDISKAKNKADIVKIIKEAQ